MLGEGSYGTVHACLENGTKAERSVKFIKREKNQRLEGIIRDVSLVGVCLMFISGFAADQRIGDKFKPASVEEENEESE